MKSSTVMAIILVVQAVLIMGVFAAVSIENSAAVGGKEGTMEPNTCCKCTNCISIANSTTGGVKCASVGDSLDWCKEYCPGPNCELVRSRPHIQYNCTFQFNGKCGDANCNCKN